MIEPCQRLKTIAIQDSGDMQQVAEAAIRRAEQNFEALKQDLDSWLFTEAEALAAMRDDLLNHPNDPEVQKAFFRIVFDFRAQAELSGHDLAWKMVDSLCRLLSSNAYFALELISSHVEGIRAAIRQGIKDPKNRVGSQLLSELVRLVDEAVKSQKA